MIGLPRHLSPWAPALGLFPEEIALALGSLVSRLAGVLGDSRLSKSGSGSPDGYDGIVNRGTYDRLMPAEWLLLDELPDEFLRRVVTGEHSFLRRAERRSATGTRSVALFDSGVDQLGAPRIVQLALLILLARRAERQGSSFEWGILQDADQRRHTAVTEASVLTLLRGRCLREATSDDVDRWIAGDPEPKPSELWLVGAANLAGEAARHGARSVLVTDVLEPGTPQRLKVEARSLDRAREAILEVPQNRLAVQLLRDPFSTAVAPRLIGKARVDPRSNLLFSPDGRRLYARGDPSTLITFHIPNSPRDAVRAVTSVRFPDYHSVIAVGRSFPRKRAVVLSRNGRRCFLHTLSRRGSTGITQSMAFAGAEEYRPEEELPKLRALAVFGDNLACYIDATGALVMLAGGKTTRKQKTRAIASLNRREHLLWVSIREGVPHTAWAQAAGSHDLEIAPLRPLEVPAPLQGTETFCFGAGLTDLYACRSGMSEWAIVEGRSWTAVAIGEGIEVVGVVPYHGSPRQPGLLVLDRGRTRLSLLQASDAQVLVTTAAPIACVETSSSGREIAYLTGDGEVGVYSCAWTSVVLRSGGEAT